MSFVFSITSHALNGGPTALFVLKEHLKSVGWTVPRSGDASASGPVGDNLPSAPLPDDSWFVLQSPDGARQILFERTTNPNSGDCWYSPSAAFTGGTATVRDTATDEVTLVTSTNFFDSAAGVLAICADDAAPYGFYMLGWTLAFSAMLVRFIFEPLEGIITGDNDPYVIHVGAGGGGPANFSLTNVGTETTSTSIDRVVGTIDNTAFGGTVPGLNYRAGATIVVPEQEPQNPYDGKDQGWPIPYARRNSIANQGFKGFGTLALWGGHRHTDLGETFENRTRIIFGSINVPWDGSVPLPS